MKIFFIGAGPGDPDLLTIKAARLLQNCRVCIYAGSLISPDVLALLPTTSEKHDSAPLSLEQIIAICRDAHQRNLDVARLHSGDPTLFGAIREQMNALDQLRIDYEIVPGVSAFQASAAALRMELTAPEVAQTVILTRVGDRTPAPLEQELDRLAQTRATLCIFLSVHKLKDIAATLTHHYGKDCPVAVVYHASWTDQRIIFGKLSDIVEQTSVFGIHKTATIVVGHALNRDLPTSKLYDANFSHGYRKTELKIKN